MSSNFDPITGDPNAPGIPNDLGEIAMYALCLIGILILIGVIYRVREKILDERRFRPPPRPPGRKDSP